MPTLGYWEIRGRCEPIRYLLYYKNVPFEDKRHRMGSNEWLQEKFSLGLDFPNLPYYIDGDTKLTQSIAILRYVGRKYGLDGKTEQDKLRVELAEQQFGDLRADLINFAISDNLEDIRPQFLKNVEIQLKEWEDFLGDRKFVTGDYITYVDFLVYEILDFYRLLEPSLLKSVPKLKGFHDRIRSLPELQKYLNGPTFKPWPLIRATAKWGGSGPAPKHLNSKA